METWVNLIELLFHVGLVIFALGLTETLRVNGRTEISADPELRTRLAINGQLSISVLNVTVERCS